MPEGKISFKMQSDKVRVVFLTPNTWIFFACVMLMNVSHGTFYGFYSIYLSDLGFKESGIGIHWAVAATTELIVFMFASRILKRFRAETLISFCCLAAAPLVSNGNFYFIWFADRVSITSCIYVRIVSCHMSEFASSHFSGWVALYRTITLQHLETVSEILLESCLREFFGINTAGNLLYKRAMMIVAFFLSISLKRRVLTAKAEGVVDRQPFFQDRPEKQNGLSFHLLFYKQRCAQTCKSFPMDNIVRSMCNRYSVRDRLQQAGEDRNAQDREQVQYNRQGKLQYRPHNLCKHFDQ